MRFTPEGERSRVPSPHTAVLMRGDSASSLCLFLTFSVCRMECEIHSLCARVVPDLATFAVCTMLYIQYTTRVQAFAKRVQSMLVSTVNTRVIHYNLIQFYLYSSSNCRQCREAALQKYNVLLFYENKAYLLC